MVDSRSNFGGQGLHLWRMLQWHCLYFVRGHIAYWSILDPARTLAGVQIPLSVALPDGAWCNCERPRGMGTFHDVPHAAPEYFSTGLGECPANGLLYSRPSGCGWNFGSMFEPGLFLSQCTFILYCPAEHNGKARRYLRLSTWHRNMHFRMPRYAAMVCTFLRDRQSSHMEPQVRGLFDPACYFRSPDESIGLHLCSGASLFATVCVGERLEQLR